MEIASIALLTVCFVKGVCCSIGIDRGEARLLVQGENCIVTIDILMYTITR